ncbi:50S ribosomal protein L15 [Candidatus Berkelbacteria bacterium]|nr:50S ribosomal protein L15 [Candidatus Berkelbacteria bacterium]
MTSLHQLPKLTRRKRRPGRGISAGQGKTAGRGTKGQKARTGYNIPAGFEGGQSKLYLRLPKRRGLRNQARATRATVTLRTLEAAYQTGERVSLATLKHKGLISSQARGVKVVATGQLTKALKFAGVQFTKSVYEQLYSQKKGVRSTE